MFCHPNTFHKFSDTFFQNSQSTLYQCLSDLNNTTRKIDSFLTANNAFTLYQKYAICWLQWILEKNALMFCSFVSFFYHDAPFLKIYSSYTSYESSHKKTTLNVTNKLIDCGFISKSIQCVANIFSIDRVLMYMHYNWFLTYYA